MESKIKVNNLPHNSIKDDRLNLPLRKCTEMNDQCGHLKDQRHILVVEDENKSEISENSNHVSAESKRCTSGTSDRNTKENIQTHINKNYVGGASGEKQSIVLNSKITGENSANSKDNSEMFRNLKEGVSDIAKACAQEYRKEDELQDDISSPADNRDEEERQNKPSRPVCSAREDAKHCLGSQSSMKIVEIHASQSDLVPENIQMMEGCDSCSHIYKGTSKEPTSNSETQTVNQTSRSTATNTSTSTHRSSSSQTTAQCQSSSSAQTSHSQTNQVCQITPEVKTTSCQTSIPKSNNIRRIAIKPWAARKYQDMCMCAELGAPCTCASRKTSAWGMVLPRNTSWWPTVKKSLLIIAAIIPWVLLIVYSIYYYRGNY